MKDFPQLPWFLRYCYNKSAAPEGSLVRNCAGLTAENVNDYVRAFDIPYAHLKALGYKLNDEAKARVATYTPDIDTILWYEQ